MPFLGGLIFVIQVFFAIHVIRSGRDRYWLYLILFLPGLGCAIYFFSEFLPEMRQHHKVKKVGTQLIKAVDPQREVRRLRDQLEIANTDANRRELAEACIAAGHIDEAISLYKHCLQFDEHDPILMEKLAGAYFQQKSYAQARQILEDLIEHNPNYKSSDGHLLYAETLQALNETRQALEEFRVLSETYPGEEARIKYAMLLLAQGNNDEARRVFEQVLLRARQAPRFYRKSQKQWITIAKQYA